MHPFKASGREAETGRSLCVQVPWVYKFIFHKQTDKQIHLMVICHRIQNIAWTNTIASIHHFYGVISIIRSIYQDTSQEVVARNGGYDRPSNRDLM